MPSGDPDAPPVVSVVIPCLNRARFLVPTLESVLQQEYGAIECLVVDGGSTDGTRDILSRYGDRIRWVSEPDDGHADAINKGWRMSRGEILAWLNADDLWAVPGAVSQAVGYLQRHPEVDVVYGTCDRLDAAGRVLGPTYLREWNLRYAVEQCDHCIPQPAAFLRRRVVESVGWLDPSFISKKDHELWLRIGLVGTIRHVPLLWAYERTSLGYLAHRGDVTAAACVALTKKFFELPGVPTALRRRRRIALGGAYLRGARYAIRDGGHYRVAIRCVMRALWLSPWRMGQVVRYGWREAQRKAAAWRHVARGKGQATERPT